jgi:hypothetical protein
MRLPRFELGFEEGQKASKLRVWIVHECSSTCFRRPEEIAGLVATLLMRAQAFSSAAQLKFRPGIPDSGVHEKPVLAHHNV